MKQQARTIPPELALRTAAASHLQANLARNGRLMAHCEKLAGARRGDRVAALNAAARLIRADAGMLSTLARVAQIESVHRTIVDKFSGLTPHGANSNSNFYQDREKEGEAAHAKLTRIVEAAVTAHERTIGQAMIASDNWERARYASAA
ncbi:MAG: hypothetical protein WBQ17_07475 [Rhizomicrobium sp.]